MVLDELLEDAPVTWARSYGGPLLPPIMLREPITDFPRDMPAKKAKKSDFVKVKARYITILKRKKLKANQTW